MVQFKIESGTSTDANFVSDSKLEQRKKLEQELVDATIEHFHSPYIVEIPMSEFGLEHTDKRTLIPIINKAGGIRGEFNQDDLQHFKLRIDSSDGAIQAVYKDDQRVINIGFMQPSVTAQLVNFEPSCAAMKFTANSDNAETKSLFSKLARLIKGRAPEESIVGLKTHNVQAGSYSNEEIARRVGETLSAVQYKAAS